MRIDGIRLRCGYSHLHNYAEYLTFNTFVWTCVLPPSSVVVLNEMSPKNKKSFSLNYLIFKIRILLKYSGTVTLKLNLVRL